MLHHYLGIDIGARVIRLAVVKGGAVRRTLSFENITPQSEGGGVLSEERAEEMRSFLRKERVFTKNCALVLPFSKAVVRRIKLPWMTEKQLKINLPYEFQDYIEGDKEQYFFDYAAVGAQTEEEPSEMELLAAMTPKETIAQYRAVLQRAGLKLSVAVPEYLSYRNLIRCYEAENSENHPEEYCIVDMGHRSTRVHMYRGAVYETSHVIDHGAARLAELAKEAPARFDGTRDDSLVLELCGTIAIEILRAINFYGFNTPGSDLRDVYLGGGVTQHVQLTETIRETVSLKIHTLRDLLVGETAEDGYAACIGAALEMGGR